MAQRVQHSECVCLKNGLKYTDMNKVRTCDNQPLSNDSVDPTADLLDEDDDDERYEDIWTLCVAVGVRSGV